MVLRRTPLSALRILVASALVVVLSASAMAYTEEDEQEASAGADASNPTAAVNFQDLRYRYFDLEGGFEKHSFETEGSYMFHPRFKVTNELRGVSTNRSGDWENRKDILEWLDSL